MGLFLRRGTAPSLGTPIGDLDVGSVVKLNADGTPWEFLVVHQGLPSSMYDASCDGTWLLMKDIYIEYAYGYTSSYDTSTINEYLNKDFFDKLDMRVSAAIKQVKIPYCKNASSVETGANGLNCKVFLLSCVELGDTGVLTSGQIDGYELDYFKDTLAKADTKRIAYFEGKAKIWFSRTIRRNNSKQIISVSRDGGFVSEAIDYKQGIRPAFILPKEFLVASKMLA